MRTSAALLALLWAAAAPARSAEPVLARALSDEAVRSAARLNMDGLGGPHYVGYTVRDSSALYVEASLGALKVSRAYGERRLRADVRVGSPAFDNSNYVGGDYWRFRPWVRDLAREDDYDALRFGAWSLTDDAYKYALQKLSEKNAYRKLHALPEEAPDLSSEAVSSGSLAQVPLEVPDRAGWERAARALSEVFRAYPLIESSQVVVDFTASRRTFVDTEGRRVAGPDGDFQVEISGYAQAEDGLPLSDSRLFAALGAGELPPLAEMREQARLLAEELSALAKAPAAEDYVGPVLLEGQAAAEFFNQLLGRGVSSPRQPWFEKEERKKDYVGGALASRLGLRVASSLLSAVDDPALAEADGVPLFGRYEVDHEGVPAQRVSLVENGILKDLLMSRAPVKERSRSNGHGRAGFQEMTASRVGSLIVSAKDPLPLSALKEELRRRAADFGLAYGILIRRLAAEERKEEGEQLSEPAAVYKVYVKDGREELVRGAEFSGVTLRALRDVAAASRERYVYNYYQAGPFLPARSYVQASVVCPSVLLSEMELRKTKRKPQKPPYLPPPSLSQRP